MFHKLYKQIQIPLRRKWFATIGKKKLNKPYTGINAHHVYTITYNRELIAAQAPRGELVNRA